ncbi:HNH endonuclease [Bacillus rhizoplanae]|uniref:HNH endonuclease n=1 Tax=Bacillus rhizoplanae TaxID=2880966 RepID=UPI003D22D0DC
MNSYLIPYLDPKKNGGEEDPLFSEYTYGDKGNRGEILKTMVSRGDFLFFHRSIGKKLYITAFYEVEKVMEIQKAKIDNTIMMRYRNHHLFSNKVQENEVIVFGNPDKSVILDTPLEVNRELLIELSIPYNPSPNQTELGALSSKFRHWFLLTESQVRLILQKANPLYNESFLELEKELNSSIVLEKTEKKLITKARIGQSIFKRELLTGEKKCKLCGVSDERFLVASHIKPWSQSNHKERLDVNNGLLLCPNHDALFDKGYISFKDDGTILISGSLDGNSKLFLNINDKLRIQMNEIQQQYMKWHRENLFQSHKSIGE